MQLALAGLGQRLIEAHHQRTSVGQRLQVLHVDHGRVRGEALAVARREPFGEVRQHVGALGFAEVLDGQRGVIVLPRTAGLHHFVFKLRGIDIQAHPRIDPQNQLNSGQHRLGEKRPELAVAGLEALHQHLLNLQADFS